MLSPLHVALLFCYALAHPSLPMERRIRDGVDTKIEDYPFLVSIRSSSNSHICGGSLISREWVLTAAHCVKDDVGNIQYGVTQIDQNNNLVGVKKIIYHKQFNLTGGFENDIALIKLSRPVELNDRVGIVKLPEPFQSTPDEYPATIVGWGKNETNGFVHKNLQKLTYRIVNCADVKRPEVTGKNICAKEYGEETGSCDVSLKINVFLEPH
jgi:trypsin